MKEKTNRHMIDILFVISLFCIFALSAIFLISIGAGIYEKTVMHMEENFSGRTAFAYVTEKIRQADSAGAVEVGEFAGNPALILSQSMEGSDYVTYLYEDEGFLKELFMPKGTSLRLGPEAGQEILAVSEFSFTQVNERLYSFFISIDEKNMYRFFISTHSQKGLL